MRNGDRAAPVFVGVDGEDVVQDGDGTVDGDSTPLEHEVAEAAGGELAAKQDAAVGRLVDDVRVVRQRDAAVGAGGREAAEVGRGRDDRVDERPPAAGESPAVVHDVRDVNRTAVLAARLDRECVVNDGDGPGDVHVAPLHADITEATVAELVVHQDAAVGRLVGDGAPGRGRG